MTDPPSNRCGYVWPDDHQSGERPKNQSCCYRKTLSDSGFCAWHTDPDQTDEKTVEILQNSRAEPEIREQNARYSELLDGAILSNLELKKAVSFERVALRDAELNGVNLKNCNLSEANLEGAELYDAEMSEADISDANLVETYFGKANLESTDFSNSNLKEAELYDSELENSVLSGANLRDASLSEAYLRWADLSDTDLRDAFLTDAYLRWADITNADLTGASLTDAFLQEADLSNSVLKRTRLSEADLKAADLSDAHLFGTNLTDAHLPDADFSGATAKHVDFTGSDLRRANFVDADLEGADFANTDLREAHLENADLDESNLEGANIERAKLSNADLFGTNLKYANIYGTRLGDAAINTETTLADDKGYCIYDPRSAHEYTPDEADESKSHQLRKAMGTYQTLEQLARVNAFPDKQAMFFVNRQDMRRRQLHIEGSFPNINYWFAEVQNLVFKHGESFSRVIAWSVVTMVFFAFLYPLGGWVKKESPTGEIIQTYTYDTIADSPILLWESLNHSALLFLTGGGPLKPVGFVGELLTTVEALIAPILLALIVFVFGRRAAR